MVTIVAPQHRVTVRPSERNWFHSRPATVAAAVWHDCPTVRSPETPPPHGAGSTPFPVPWTGRCRPRTQQGGHGTGHGDVGSRLRRWCRRPAPRLRPTPDSAVPPPMPVTPPRSPRPPTPATPLCVARAMDERGSGPEPRGFDPRAERGHPAGDTCWSRRDGPTLGMTHGRVRMDERRRGRRGARPDGEDGRTARTARPGQDGRRGR